MPFQESIYRAVLRAARIAAPLAAGGETKLARGIRGRRGAVERLEAWGREHRDVGRALVWFHAPSVGEGLQARAVLEALVAERPGVQTVFTHFSPSADRLAAAMPVDVADYLPWDLPDALARVLDALRPDLVVFTKTEVWPTLSTMAEARGTPMALVAATLPERSSRNRPLARSLLAPSFRRLSAILAIADDDAARFAALGGAPDALRVTGDPGIDSAAERAAALSEDADWRAPLSGSPGPVLVAGSTWPADEAVLLDALDGLRRRHGLLPVLAPHEPDAAHLGPLVEGLRRAGWNPVTLAEVEARGTLGEHDAVVVERVGVLAQLYTVGDLAYVGGGFGEDGLHSVLEPAAAGLPVAFGPHHATARSAGELIRAGAGAAVADARALEATLDRWLVEPAARTSAGEAARGYITAHRGAARRSAEVLATFLPPPTL